MGLFDRILRRLRGAPEPARQDAPGLFTARSPGLSTGQAAPPEAPAPPEDLWDRPDPAPAPAVAGAVDPDVTEPVVMEPGVLEPEDVAPGDEPTEAIASGAGIAEPIDPAAELAAIEELAPPAAEPETPVAPAWDDATWTEAGATTGLPERTAEDAPVGDAVAPEGSTADEPLFGYGTAPEPPVSAEPPPGPVPPLFDPPAVATEPEPGDVAPEVTTGAEPDPAPAAEAEPRPLVVETHPEVFDVAPAGDAAPAEDDPSPTPTADEPVAGEEQRAAERTMRVHDERLDKRPGPIRMTPSEAIRLAQDGPRTARRADQPEA
ncbi:MAG: hypothetical protein KY457_13645 [Actinobacteria bacterium]|nr:hypothetical protein [Actinomycetota bacterium]